MPNYDYQCDSCGPFTARQSMSAYADPAPCPSCGSEAPRALPRPAVVCGTDGGLSGSSQAPAAHRHSSGCGCGH